MELFRNIGILGSLALIVLTGCSDAAQEASSNEAPVAQQVTLATATTPAYVGSILRGQYQYTDPNNDSEGGSQHAWLRDGQLIEGANQDIYTATAQDSGKSLQYRVTPAAATGTSPGATAVSAGITIENSAPSVTLSGLVGAAAESATSVGSVLRAAFSYNDVDGDAADAAEIRWLQGANAIEIATGPTYTVTRTDLGSYLVAEVTPQALQGVLRGTAVRSPPIFIINSAPIAQNVKLKATTPVIIGSALTASYTYFDADNESEAGSSIQWLRNGVAIAGATTPIYTLTAPTDVGANFQFTVTPRASSGTSPGISVTSNTVTAVNSAPRASNLVVNGGITSTVVGTTLSASYAYSDLDLNPQGASIHRWYRGTNVISGATTVSYTVVAADSGKDLAFEVIPVAAQGVSPGMAVRSPAIRVNNSAPQAKNVTLALPSTAIPPPKVGHTLVGSYTYFDADGNAEATSTFRWLRNDMAIAGATGLSYTLGTADAPSAGTPITIVFEVTPLAAAGEARGNPARSNSIAVANSAPTASTVLITPGSARVATVLTTSFTFADADGDKAGNHLYEWRNGNTVIGTALTYTVKASDAHQTLTVKVTPVALSGSSPGVAATSPGITIGNSPPSVTGVTISSSIDGPAYTGVVLTAGYKLQDADGDGEGASSYEWRRDGAAIVGATALTYTVTSADIGKALTVQVTPKDNFVPALAGTPATSSAITPVNLRPVASNVVVNGKAVNQASGVLNVTYVRFDQENDLEPATGSTIQWLRNSTAIPGANRATYTLTLADAGKTLAAQVTPLSQTGTSPGLSGVSNSVAVQPANVALNAVSAGLKQLRFSWTAVPGASSYRVSYSPAEGAGFVPVSTTSSNITTTTYDWNISVHRINWPKAQFMLEACDASNFCLPSASVNALSVMLGAIGYFKASNTGASDYFGTSVALSGNGLTLAVGAPYENSAGINGIQADGCGATPATNCAQASGAVYVYTRSGNTWMHQAYVKASNPGADDNFGWSIALSADGNTLAVGALNEDSAQTGVILGAPAEIDTPNSALGISSGAVYVYTRSNTIWAQQAYVKASNPEISDIFGYALALSADGSTLAVGAYLEDGQNTGITSGSPTEVAAPNGIDHKDSGAVYVYGRTTTTWVQQAYVKASNTGLGDYFGWSIALSSNGNTLAVGAWGEGSTKTGVTPGEPKEAIIGNGAGHSGAVYVYIRSAAAIWAQQAYIKSSNTQVYDRFGNSVSLSADGNTLAVAAYVESSMKTGVTPGAPNEAFTGDGAAESGAVYIYIRNVTTWSQQAYVKASNTEAGDLFGISIALSADGNTLAVGAHGEDSATIGVTSGAASAVATPNNLNYGTSGAVYIYTRNVAIWSQQAYVKASNTGGDDNFGGAVALSTDGSTLAVGAYGEKSAATGVNNTVPGQSNNSAAFAGAVYLY